MIENIHERLKVIQALCLAFNKLASKYGTAEYKAADEAFWSAVQALDSEAKLQGAGPQVGRLIKLPYADGYARYIITRVQTKVVKMEHLPYGSGYHSPVVRDGEADKGAIEMELEFYDGMDAAIKKCRNQRNLESHLDYPFS